MAYQSKFPHGIMFHRFKNEKDQNSANGTLTSKNLTKIINLIGRKRILGPKEWIQRMDSGNLLNKDVCFTFDDGLKSQIKIALPILEKFNIKAFWFVHCKTLPNNFDKNEIFSFLIVKKFKNFTNFAYNFLDYIKINKNVFNSQKFNDYYNEEKKLYKFHSKIELKYKFLRDIYYSRKKFESTMENFFKKYGINVNKFYKNTWLDKKDLIKLDKKGHVIGLHSYSHPYRMKSLSEKEQKNEYNKNFKYLKSVLKKKPFAMSHPLDSYNDFSLKILKKLKIKCGFRSHTKTSKGSRINPSFLEFAREDPSNMLKLK